MASASQLAATGELVVEYARRRVTVAGEAVELTPPRVRLLTKLSVNAGRRSPMSSSCGACGARTTLGVRGRCAPT